MEEGGSVSSAFFCRNCRRDRPLSLLYVGREKYQRCLQCAGMAIVRAMDLPERVGNRTRRHSVERRAADRSHKKNPVATQRWYTRNRAL